jgi:hypothetical protein
MGQQGRRYRVTVHYREPTYARRNGDPGGPYRFTVEVVAVDAESACAKGVDALDRQAALSSVSWVRSIERVLALEIDERA